MSAAVLATAADVPANYLSKILHQLVQARILKSVRGKNGGFELAVPPEELPLLRVVAQFDDLGLDGMCLFGRSACSGEESCPVHERWGIVAAHMLDFFCTTTVSDVC